MRLEPGLTGRGQHLLMQMAVRIGLSLSRSFQPRKNGQQRTDPAGPADGGDIDKSLPRCLPARIGDSELIIIGLHEALWGDLMAHQLHITPQECIEV